MARRLGRRGESKGTWQRVVLPGYRWTSPSGENLVGIPIGYKGRERMGDSESVVLELILCCCDRSWIGRNNLKRMMYELVSASKAP